MNASAISAQSTQSYNQTSLQFKQIQIQQLTITAKFGDTVEFGKNPPSRGESLNIVLERSYAKLTALVGEAKDTLGIAQDSPLDTSPEATANRIADFALNFFDRYLENHPELEGEGARQAFADFIGGAIQQGIQEAEDILSALSVLNDGVKNNIGTIKDIIAQRLAAFVGQED